MNLTDANYHSAEANRAYMSVSQWKASLQCPARWHAQYIAGMYSPVEKGTLELGTLTHSATLEPAAELVIPDILRNKPTVADVKAGRQGKIGTPALRAMDTATRLNGIEDVACIWQGAEIEKIRTFQLAGMPWKMKTDCVRHEDLECWDLKTTRGISHTEYSTQYKRRVPWYLHYRYDLQLALYQEGLFQDTEDIYDMGLIAVTLPTEALPTPDLRVMRWEDNDALSTLVEKTCLRIPRVQAWREGNGAGLLRCEQDDCDFCRQTRTDFDVAIGPVEVAV